MDPTTTEQMVRTFTYEAMYRGASIALNFAPGERTLSDLGALTRTSAEAVRACALMRDAGENKRVYAALDYLRAQRDAEVATAPKAAP